MEFLDCWYHLISVVLEIRFQITSLLVVDAINTKENEKGRQILATLPLKLINYKKCSCKNQKHWDQIGIARRNAPEKQANIQSNLEVPIHWISFNGHKYLYTLCRCCSFSVCTSCYYIASHLSAPSSFQSEIKMITDLLRHKDFLSTHASKEQQKKEYCRRKGEKKCAVLFMICALWVAANSKQ